MWDYKIGQGRIIKTYQGIILSFDPVISFLLFVFRVTSIQFFISVTPESHIKVRRMKGMITS